MDDKMTQKEAEELVYEYENALLKSTAKTYTSRERIDFAVEATTLKHKIVEWLSKQR